jgi:hypothetical protein
MAEYIEREKAIAEIDKGDLLVGDNAKWAKEILCRTPTADVVEVVRCGECEHFKEYPIIDTSIPSGWGKCTKINMDIDLTINDYCSYGERRCEE